jgi:hypothetical protein
VICLAQKYNTGEYVTILSLADRLKISKIYLEQVFSIFKRTDLVSSIKTTLSSISLESLVLDVQKHSLENGYMFYL